MKSAVCTTITNAGRLSQSTARQNRIQSFGEASRSSCALSVRDQALIQLPFRPPGGELSLREPASLHVMNRVSVNPF